MNIKTFLSDIGTKLKDFFTKDASVVAEADKVAIEAEPFVDIAFPGAAPLYNTVAGAVGQAEAAAVAAGAQNGTGAQKLATVLSNPQVQQAFATIEAAAGIQSATTAQQVAYINAVVASLNALSATPDASVGDAAAA